MKPASLQAALIRWHGGDWASDGAANTRLLPIPIKNIDTTLRPITFIAAPDFTNIAKSFPPSPTA